MKLIGKEDFQKELWKQSGVELLQRFPEQVKQNYQFIFALNDWLTLLKLDNELVQEHMQFIQSCLIESMIQLSLNEIMQPLQFKYDNFLSFMKTSFLIQILLKNITDNFRNFSLKFVIMISVKIIFC